MKNNFRYFLLIIFCNLLVLKAVNANEPFVFNVTEIEILDNGNQINGYEGGTATSEDGSTITAENFFYNKLTNILEATGSVKYIDVLNDIIITSEKAIYFKNNEKVITSGNSKAINDNNTITASSLEYDKKNNIFKAIKNAVVNDRLKGRVSWDGIKDNIFMVNGDQCETMERLNYIITKGGPFDIVIIDQLDKMQVRGTFTRDDLRLSQVYIKARTLAKKHNLAVIAISQAGAEADGRTSLRFTQMANSKIGKAAEADVIIGIGKENTETQDDNFLRYLHVSKNKLGGSHGRATVRIEPKISRYID